MSDGLRLPLRRLSRKLELHPKQLRSRLCQDKTEEEKSGFLDFSVTYYNENC